MAGRVSLVLSLALMAFLHNAAAQTRHIVGDGNGWTNTPPGGAAFYANWAAGRRFVVGDSLVFNFLTDVQDVQRVTKESFDRCDDDNGEIGDEFESSPATISLISSGEYYFISTKDNHCAQGQKLAITVTASAGSTPPSSNTPTPTTTPPTQTVHTVGNAIGWTIPPGGATFYSNWAADKTFVVGDSLVFNFPTDVQNVQRVTKESFVRCDDDNGEIGDDIENGPATINLSTPGEYYFICTKDNHCEQGQKLAINVSATRSAMPPSNTPTSRQPEFAALESSAHSIAAAASVTLFGLILGVF